MARSFLHCLESCLCDLRRYFLNYPLSKLYYFIFEKFLRHYNFKFGKVDVGRHPDAAAKYHISDASMSKQLPPTLILFKEGKEVDRRSYADHKGKLVKFHFSIVS